MGSINRGNIQNETCSTKRPRVKKPAAIIVRVMGRISFGWYLSYIQPAIIGTNKPSDWLGNSTIGTNKGDLPNPSSTSIGIRVMVATIEK